MISKTDVMCECGEINIDIEDGFVGFMGDRQCSESYGKCPRCHKIYNNDDINKRFNDINKRFKD